MVNFTIYESLKNTYIKYKLSLLTQNIMLKIKSILAAVLTIAVAGAFAQKTTTVRSFEKVIVSPYIQVTFVEGNEEAVTVESCSVPMKKFNIESKGGTLRI